MYWNHLSYKDTLDFALTNLSPLQWKLCGLLQILQLFPSPFIFTFFIGATKLRYLSWWLGSVFCMTCSKSERSLRWQNIKTLFFDSILTEIAQSVQWLTTGWMTEVWFPAGVGIFSLRRRVQNDYGTNPSSYSMDNGGRKSWSTKLTTHFQRVLW
jgi:hypothetical protein